MNEHRSVQPLKLVFISDSYYHGETFSPPVLQWFLSWFLDCCNSVFGHQSVCCWSKLSSSSLTGIKKPDHITLFVSGCLSHSADLRSALITPASLLSRLGSSPSRKRNPKVPAAPPLQIYCIVSEI